MKPKLIIIGTGGHAKVVAEAVLLKGEYEILGFIDDFKAKGEDFMGYPVLGNKKDLHLIDSDSPLFCFVAIGDNYQRQRVAEWIPEYMGIPTIIHPSAIISNTAEIEQGTFIAAGAIIGASCKIAEGVIVNTGASVDHDCVLCEYSSVAPKSVLGGTCFIGECSAICIGATISNKIKVGYATVIGAGALAIKDVPDCVVAHGIPCKVVRGRSVDDKYLK